MKKYVLIVCIFLGLQASAFILPNLTFTGSDAPAFVQFTPNVGQFSSFIKAKAEISGGNFYFSGNAFVYHFTDFDKIHELTHGHATSDTIAESIVKVSFVGASKTCQPVFSTPFPDYQNYIKGNDPQKWFSRVYSYQTMSVSDFYPNIDLNLTSKGPDLKYDLIVGAGADVSKIKIKYEGAKEVKLTNGFLQVKTGLTDFVELKPKAWQIINGVKKNISCAYLLANNQLSFSLGNNYNSAYELTIDPQIVFSSFSGSKADNFGYTATFDQEGNSYIGGIVYSLGAYVRNLGFSPSDSALTDNGVDIFGIGSYPVDSFPASPGAYKTRFQGGFSDVVIFKFSKDGKRRLYATYLGGNATETPQSMIVNKDNQLIVMGATSSNNYPVTQNAFSTTGTGTTFTTNTNGLVFQNGSHVFLTILNETGTNLVASTVLRTNGNAAANSTNFSTKNYYNFGDEFRGEVAIDSLDNSIAVATYTTSDLIPTETIPKTKVSTDELDAWVFKINSDLSQLIFSKRFGGSGIDVAYGLQPDKKGNMFFSGHTSSTDLLGTLTGLNTSNQGKLDGYVVKMDRNGNFLAASYLGTAEDDQAFFVQTDLNNDVYVMGQTWSNAYPITANGINPFFNNPGSGQFIHKLNNSLSGTLFSTAFGSGIQGPDISPTAFLIDNCGLIYVSGWRGLLFTVEPASPARRLPLADQLPYNPISASGFYFGVFGNNMQGLVKGTYFGNDGIDHVDGGTSRFDKRGYIHQAICASCRGTQVTPTTPDVWSPTNKSQNCNMLGVKFDFETVDVKAVFTSTPPVINDTIKLKPGQNIDFSFTGQTLTGSNVSWLNYSYLSPIKRFITEEKNWTARPGFPLPTFMSLRKWVIETDYAKSPTCVQLDNQIFYVVIEPSITGASICNGDTGRFNIIGGARSAKWTPITGLNNPDIQNPKVWSDVDRDYTVEVWANDNSYFGRYPAKVKVVNYAAEAKIAFLSDSSGNFPLTVAMQNQGSINNRQLHWELGDGTTLSGETIAYTFEKIGQYHIKLKIVNDSSGCVFVDSAKTKVTVTPKINDLIYCPDNPIGQFTILGGVLCVTNPNGNKVDNKNSCNPVFTFVGNSQKPEILVYSEPNKPYSYIFTVSGISNSYPATDFAFTTSIVSDWNSADVKFTGLTSVQSQRWNVGTDEIFRDSIFSVIYNKSDVYPVNITGIDKNNCRFEVNKNIAIELLFIPNIITPNNDNINDAFEIRGLKPNSGSIEIFNRWGTKVYESEEYSYKNDWKADSQPDGLYFYTFKLNYRPNKPFKGWIEVLR